MIGRNDSIGPVASPNRPARLPSWKISVTTPNAPAIESRLKMPALTGISSERKTTASSSSDSPTTTPMNSGSLSRIVCEKSMFVAVAPPIDTRVPVSCSTGGRVTSRAVLTVSSVRSSCGVVAGPGQLDREQQRGVEAGPEALLQEVVGDPRGVVLLVRAGIARGQAHVQRGH